MLLKITNLSLLASTTQLTFVLIITAAIFLFFIVIAVVKMYKLKAENKRLTKTELYKSDADTNYKDFTEGHMYDNK
jgi:putative copper export protein